VVLPILTVPLGELATAHAATLLIPSAASIDALSTVQRLNGAQSPFRVVAEAGAAAF
jgi:hypothetical protein